MNSRRLRRFFSETVMTATIFTLAFARPAHAYVDPGSASIIITAILGAFAAVSYSARIYLKRIKNFFTKDKRDSERK